MSWSLTIYWHEVCLKVKSMLIGEECKGEQVNEGIWFAWIANHSVEPFEGRKERTANLQGMIGSVNRGQAVTGIGLVMMFRLCS